MVPGSRRTLPPGAGDVRACTAGRRITTRVLVHRKFAGPTSACSCRVAHVSGAAPVAEAAFRLSLEANQQLGPSHPSVGRPKGTDA